ncbi:hypothetical protein P43SY_001903 [Pythium insidiosum]|uniref:Autophagy-related protein 101 n=1 Tax=Pythium insidiosum TaxID=114742 RepID=A0AAD5LCA4_PYTIN|nr:hypothetical protein P43SY_001903 [Pythium insidiosum]
MASPSASTPWRENVLDEIPVNESDLGDAVTCILHTILFTRAPGPVRPSEATCHAFPAITYSLCAVGDVSRKVEQAVKGLEENLLGSSSLQNGADAFFDRRQSATMAQYRRESFSTIATGCIVIAFFERKVKKALFGLMSNEEKVYFEKWVLPVAVVSPTPSEDTERALQHALLHINSAVQTIDHIPNAMYDFEVSECLRISTDV